MFPQTSGSVVDVRNILNEAINYLLLEAARRRGLLAHEGIKGLIRFRELPFADYAEYERWWLPLYDSAGKIIRGALMSEREKSRYDVSETSNILTVAGRNQVLTYIASQNSNTAPFAQYFAIGNFPINSVNPGDTSIQGEIFRAPPSTTNITGTQVDLATFIPQGQALANFSNVGLLGINSLPGIGAAGTLVTHALTTYTKGNVPVTSDYVLSMQ